MLTRSVPPLKLLLLVVAWPAWLSRPVAVTLVSFVVGATLSVELRPAPLAVGFGWRDGNQQKSVYALLS
jgi:hypothetical protein